MSKRGGRWHGIRNKTYHFLVVILALAPCQGFFYAIHFFYITLVKVFKQKNRLTKKNNQMSSKILAILQDAHEAAGKEQANDPRMRNVLAHLNQAIGVIDPKAAGQARSSVTPAAQPAGRFGSTPPDRKQSAVNPYDIPGKKKVVAPAVDPVPQVQEQESTTGEILEAKAAVGQLTQVDGGLKTELATMTPQEMSKKYTKPQLVAIAATVEADVDGMKSATQIAAAIKRALS